MRLVILGAGGYANTVRDVAEQLGYEIVAMLDDKLQQHSLASFIDYVVIPFSKPSLNKPRHGSAAE